MLRIALRRSPATSVLFPVAAAPRLLMARRLNSNDNNSGTPKSKEDADELEREKKLREMFEKKQGPPSPPNPFANVPQGGSFMDQLRAVQANAKKYAEEQAAYRVGQRGGAAPGAGAGSGDQQSSGSSSGEGSQQQQQQGQQQGNPVPPPFFAASQAIWTILLYSTALYAMAIVWQLGDDQSFVSMTQGVPHWAVQGTDLATFLMFRVLYSMRDQSRIRREYDSYIATHSSSSSASPTPVPPQSFSEFFNQRYGAAVNGSTVAFADAVALVAGAMRLDFGRYSRVITDAAKKSSDVRAKVDAIAMALKAAGVTPAYPYAVQQQQQQQYYQQYYAAQGYGQTPSQQQQYTGHNSEQQKQQQQQQQQQQWQPPCSSSAVPDNATTASSSSSADASSSQSMPVLASPPAAAVAAAADSNNKQPEQQQQQQQQTPAAEPAAEKKQPADSQLLVGLVQQSVTTQKPQNDDGPKPTAA